jgi:hypothetical protein
MAASVFVGIAVGVIPGWPLVDNGSGNHPEDQAFRANQQTPLTPAVCRPGSIA